MYPSQVQVRGTQWGYPNRGYLTRGVPKLGGTLTGVPQWGYPTSGTPPTRPGGVPRWGYPNRGYPALGTPLSDLDGGYPNRGGTPLQLTDGVLDKRRSVCLLRSRRRTFLFITKFYMEFQLSKPLQRHILKEIQKILKHATISKDFDWSFLWTSMRIF